MAYLSDCTWELVDYRHKRVLLPLCGVCFTGAGHRTIDECRSESFLRSHLPPVDCLSHLSTSATAQSPRRIVSKKSRKRHTADIISCSKLTLTSSITTINHPPLHRRLFVKYKIMVAFTSSFGRYAVLLSVVGFGKSNYVTADGSSLMEPSSAAWTDVHRQLVQCCVGAGGACHPNDACNSNQRDCERASGPLKCNRSGNYQWGDPGTAPPPPTPKPISAADLCCVEIGTSACHPNDSCNLNQRDCERASGRLKCNRSGNYQWGDPGTAPPPPPPTSPPTPKPVSFNAL